MCRRVEGPVTYQGQTRHAHPPIIAAPPLAGPTQVYQSSTYWLEPQEWDVYIVDEVRAWIDGLDQATLARVVQAIAALAEAGPSLGRPLVDTISGSSIANLKELRPGTVRILFVFDPWRSSILLVAGDKAGQWNAW